MGPGTHVITRILRGDKPVAHNDFLAMLHDVQYLQTVGHEPTIPDQLAVVLSDYSVPGLAMKAGLLTRYGFKLGFNTNPYNVTNGECRSIGDALMQIIKEQHGEQFTKYDINPNYYYKTFGYVD